MQKEIVAQMANNFTYTFKSRKKNFWIFKLFFALLCAIIGLKSNAQNYYVKSNTFTNNIQTVCEINQSIYALNIFHTYPSSFFYDPKTQILRLNSQLQLVDTLTLNYFRAYQFILPISDSTLLICGSRYRSPTLNTNSDIELMVIDTSWNILYESLIHEQLNMTSTANHVVYDNNGKIYIVGTHYSVNSNSSYSYLYKLSPDLDSLNAIFLDSNASFQRITFIDSVIYVSCNDISSSSMGSNNLLKIDTSFQLSNLKYISIDSLGYNNNPFQPNKIEPASYSQLIKVDSFNGILCALSQYYTSTFPNANQTDIDLSYVKFNFATDSLTGYYSINLLDSNEIGGRVGFASSKHNCAYIACITYNKYSPNTSFLDYGNYTSTIIVRKIDASFNMQWEKRLGGNVLYYINSIHATKDSCVIISGTIYDSLVMPGPFVLNSFILKIDKNGNSYPLGVNHSTTGTGELLVYPNPSSQYITITNEAKQIQSVEIADIQGKKEIETTANANKIIINTSALELGVYTLLIKYTDGTYSKSKFINSK